MYDLSGASIPARLRTAIPFSLVYSRAKLSVELSHVKIGIVKRCYAQTDIDARHLLRTCPGKEC